MKVFLAIAVCKVLYFVGKLVGKGSSLPGQVALKVCPDVLKRLRLPGIIIAVTGSNGKTSTTELIARALESSGMSVGWNHEGANQVEGVATLLLRIATFGGTVRRDALVLECDERYARVTFRDVRPSVVVVTNLCRDQLTRNGHPEFIQDCIRAAIETCQADVEGGASAPRAGHGARDRSLLRLVLNADDPYVAALAGVAACDIGGNCGRDAVLLEAGVGTDADDGSGEAGADADAIYGGPTPAALWFGVGRSLQSTPRGISSSLQSAPRGTSSPLQSTPRGTSSSLQSTTCGINCEMYDDGAFCPVCKGRMTYEYRVAGHFGDYDCSGCGLSRPEPEIEISGIDYQTGEVTIISRSPQRSVFSAFRAPGPSPSAPSPSPQAPGAPPQAPGSPPRRVGPSPRAPGSPRSAITTRLTFPSLTGAYNLAAAIAAAVAAGVSAEDAARGLDGFELSGGRTIRFSTAGRQGILLVSKHENSLSYNQSLSWISGRGTPCTVIVLVDSISRKYYTSETSWLWDVDFDILANESVRNVVLAGRYVNELAARFVMSDVEPGRISHIGDLGGLREYVERATAGDIYAITCFSDKGKLIKVFE